MRSADNVEAGFVLILGDVEIEKGTVMLRNMKDKTQHELPLDPHNILQEFKKYI